MLGPAVRRSRTRGKVLSVFLMGSIAGASLTATLGFLVGEVISPVPTVVRTTLLVLAAVVAIGIDSRRLRLRLPQNRRLIPQSVLRKGPIRGSFQFALELGSGLRTYLPTAAPHFLLAALVLSSPMWYEALAVALGFGVGRWGPIAWAATSRAAVEPEPTSVASSAFSARGTVVSAASVLVLLVAVALNGGAVSAL